jgi:hypothetical protein
MNPQSLPHPGRSTRLVLPASALVVVLLSSVVPRPAVAEFRCAASFDYHANRCASSLITSISREDGAAVCTEFTRRISETCRPDWDKFKTCQEFARRFESLLVDTCKSRKVPAKSCRAWGDVYAEGERNRCERGHATY